MNVSTFDSGGGRKSKRPHIQEKKRVTAIIIDANKRNSRSRKVSINVRKGEKKEGTETLYEKQGKTTICTRYRGKSKLICDRFYPISLPITNTGSHARTNKKGKEGQRGGKELL